MKFYIEYSSCLLYFLKLIIFSLSKYDNQCLFSYVFGSEAKKRHITDFIRKWIFKMLNLNNSGKVRTSLKQNNSKEI